MSHGNELKSCPFCGGEAAVFTYNNEEYDVKCRNPYCLAKSGRWDTEAEAIAAWNTRADDYRQAAEYWQRMYEDEFRRTCKVEGCCMFSYDFSPEVYYEFEMQCGGSFDWNDEEPPSYCPNCGARVTKSDQDLLQEVGE